MMKPIGRQDEIAALDEFIEECLKGGRVQDLVRLNTYVRRYFSPLITRDLFRRKQLPVLLRQQEIDIVTALVLDIRGFVHATQSGEHSSEGLDVVARLLRTFFVRTIRAAFENYGLVGEFAGDRVLVTFGFPPQLSMGSADDEQNELAVNVRRAVTTAFAIHRVSEEIRADESFPSNVRQLDVGIGICAGGPAWVGDIGGNDHLGETKDFWRHELTVISTAVNIAARAEEVTKNDELMAAAPDKKIIADKTVLDQIQQLAAEHDYTIRDLGPADVRGLDKKVHLFHLINLEPDVLPAPEPITEDDKVLVDWICRHIDGAIERDIAGRVHRSLSDVEQIIVSSAVPDEEAVFEQIMAQIITLFKSQKATLYRVDPATGALVVVTSVGPSPLPGGTKLPPGTGVAGWVASKGQSFISRDVHTDERWAGRDDSRYDSSIHSMMCVPLRTGPNIVGVIQIMDDSVGAFNEARSIISDAFASARTLNEVLDAVMVAVREALSAHNATLYLIDTETSELVFEKIISESTNPPIPGTRLPAGTGIVGQVVADKTPLLIPDTREASEWYGKIGSDMRSLICVPLVARGRTVGAIQVLDRSPHSFSQEDLEILQWLSASAAVAVDSTVQLEQTRRKLIASEAVAGLGAISGRLAHNLKNYVGGIKAIAKFQLKTDDPKSKERIDKIVSAADRALTEIMDFMQPLTGWEATNVDLDATLMELTSEVTGSLEARQQQVGQGPHIAIQHQRFDQPTRVYAGRDQIRYVFQNLIDNAIRAIDEKGESKGQITLKTSVERMNETEWAVVTVEDTGTGIPPENIERIFEPSFTTRPEGTIGGYGLFWTRLNVERIGGRITASSEYGVRATFRVRLPLVRKPA
jgi:signal transduction histidine kinase/class 3 adenylate cyclase